MTDLRERRIGWIVIVGITAVLGLRLCLQAVTAGSGTVNGSVANANGPLSGARVRVRATGNLTFTDPSGHFLLTGLTAGEEVEVTAWYTGHYIAYTHVTPTISGVTLTLRPYHTVDNPDYHWTSPISGTSSGACGNCHPMIFSQWINNAHGGAVNNPRFYSLYDGTNISGTAVIRPGYLLDFPGTDGNCANCHAPGAGVDGYLTVGMDNVRSVITAGIHCDFCHKVGGVYLDPATNSVYPNVPGVQGQRVLRPPAGDNIFFGPYDDIHDPDTYLPLMDQSQFCATCHQFSFWGTPIYESYEEWLASSYPQQGIICQDCHMPPSGDNYFALPSAGGLPHPPDEIPSHLQPGASSAALLQQTVSMTIGTQQVANQLLVTVLITNTGAGHHVPTDHPGRNLILVVSATDDQMQSLHQQSGPTVPVWGGAQAGLPGQGFAKVLKEATGGQFPVVSYWKPTVIVSDNRIPALATDRSSYTFVLPPSGGHVNVTAQLTFRRLFQPLAVERGWNTHDLVMETITTSLPVQPWSNLYLPSIIRQ